MSENIERVNQVTAIVKNHLDKMLTEVWDTLRDEEKTRSVGSYLDSAEYNILAVILHELKTISVCE